MLFAEPILETNPQVLEAVKEGAGAKAAEAEAAAAGPLPRTRATKAAATTTTRRKSDDDDRRRGRDGDEAEEMDVTRCDATDAAEDVSIAGGGGRRAAR